MHNLARITHRKGSVGRLRDKQKRGNFIVGRKTFQEMSDPSRVSQEEQENTEGPFAGIDIVVLSKNIENIPGVTVVKSPQEAISYLSQKGHLTALIGGGADIHNSF